MDYGKNPPFSMNAMKLIQADDLDIQRNKGVQSNHFSVPVHIIMVKQSDKQQSVQKSQLK